MTLVDGVLRALDDPTRRSLLEDLVQHGTATATSLSSRSPVSRQAVVQHLDVLTRAGLVRGDRHGRERRYVLCSDTVKETARWLDDLATAWDRRLASIKSIAESP